ncbi:sporulation YhaL family protein [Fictibacillus iocasae]|uniref:Sporulation YhaL family protein n=1 Tax=Fictibacillus iocasae TaxID=2715437 RepID=A0ABW2NTF2_9BACL
MRGYAALFFGVILITAFVLKEYSGPVEALFNTTPWWMYFVLGGIILSAYRSYTAFSFDREEEMKLIEEEGKVYMERIAERRAKTGTE